MPVDLAVDMDGTLFLTDTLAEGFFEALFHHPRDALRAVAALPRGRAAVKAVLRPHSVAAVATLPVRSDLLLWLDEQAAAGRRLHLVTAADQQVAAAAARRFDLFDDVVGTSAAVNLKGVAKRDELDRRFAGGWAYAGDSSADLPVFGNAASIVLTGRATRFEAGLVRDGKHVEARFPHAAAGCRDWFRALRIHQWAKNLLIFVPAMLSGTFADPDRMLQVALAFVLLSLCASGTYIINDLADLRADRVHATKRERPFASGRIPLATGLGVAVVLIAACLLAATALSSSFAGWLLLYVVTTLAYSLRLKRLPMLDVSVLACLYTLRLKMGSDVADVMLSGWLAAFSLTFFLSLSLAKRYAEIAKQLAVPGLLPGRGYRASDGPLVITFGIASGMAALQLMILFLVFKAFHGSNYAAPQLLLGTPLLTFLWLTRVWLLASRAELRDDPVVFAVRDPLSLVLGAAMALSAVFAAIGPPF